MASFALNHIQKSSCSLQINFDASKQPGAISGTMHLVNKKTRAPITKADKCKEKYSHFEGNHEDLTVFKKVNSIPERAIHSILLYFSTQKLFDETSRICKLMSKNVCSIIQQSSTPITFSGNKKVPTNDIHQALTLPGLASAVTSVEIDIDSPMMEVLQSCRNVTQLKITVAIF